MNSVYLKWVIFILLSRDKYAVENYVWTWQAKYFVAKSFAGKKIFSCRRYVLSRYDFYLKGLSHEIDFLKILV
jgi:hypothetical protein